VSLTPRARCALAALVVVTLAAVLLARHPSRVERAEAAARRACEVFREPFDGTNPKMDALPADERVKARHARLLATERETAKAARLDPRWSVLHDAWHDFVSDDGRTEATGVILAECRVALAD